MVVFVAVSCDGIISEECCTYVLTPYRNLTNRSAPFGLDLLGFHSKNAREAKRCAPSVPVHLVYYIKVKKSISLASLTNL